MIEISCHEVCMNCKLESHSLVSCAFAFTRDVGIKFMGNASTRHLTEQVEHMGFASSAIDYVCAAKYVKKITNFPNFGANAVEEQPIKES